jgi:hypothetical protein
MGAAHASLTLPAGTCQNFTLFNETNNSTILQEICAENATVVENYTCQEVNLTIWANSTRYINNVTISCLQNVSTVCQNVSFCPSANLTLWANSTSDFYGNGTVTCLGNLTVLNVTNITQNYSCPEVSLTMFANSTRLINNATISCLSNRSNFCAFSATVTPQTSDIRLQNVSGLDILVQAIPQGYCYENRYETANTTAVWRSDRSNNTFVCQPSSSVSCPAQRECPAPVEQNLTCPPPVVCHSDDTVLKNLNESVYGENGYVAQLQAKDNIIAQYQTAAATINQQIDSEVKKEVGNVQDIFEYGLLAFIVGLGFWVAKTRTSPIPTKYGKVVTAEEIDKLVPPKPPMEG